MLKLTLSLLTAAVFSLSFTTAGAAQTAYTAETLHQDTERQRR